MSEIQRTSVYVGVAAVTLAVALLAAPKPPQAPKDFQEVGKEFYPNFTNSSDAKELNVIAYDGESAAVRNFGIKLENGQWRIPSRHNYPVDGKDRLAKCAASIIGLKREAVVGVREAEHPEFEVVDPLGDSSSLKRGQRIQLKGDNDVVLADYIIGKAVPNRSGQFYVRRPDEKVTYAAKLSLDLSTKFSDWIEPDLLKVDSVKLNGITVDGYSLDTNRGLLVDQERSSLSRKTSTEPWKLEGLDEAADEEVNQDEVRKIVDALDNLKIVGVRPKPLKLQRDLKVDGGITVDQNIRRDLMSAGYFLMPVEGGGSQLISKEGSLIATTDQGVAYLMHFGDVFSGSEEEIEFGFTKQEEAADKDKEKDKEPKPGDSNKKSRYLFVTCHLDPEAIGTLPVEPTKPEPIGDAPAEAAPVREPESTADATQPDNVGPAAEYAAKKQAYDAAVAQYEADQKKFEADSKSFAEKVKDGEKKVKELNNRFADWYYVISADSFENLRQGRKTLVKAKGSTPADPAGSQSKPPAFNFPPM